MISTDFYFFENFSEYLINLERTQEGHMNVNYNFLVKLYSELNNDQKLKFSKSLEASNIGLEDEFKHHHRNQSRLLFK